MRYLLVLLALSAASCQRETDSPVPSAAAVPSAPAAAAPAPPGRVVLPADSPKLKQLRIAAVESAEVPGDEVTAPGKVEVNPNRVANVALPVPGRITSVAVRIGEYVRQGETILTIESPDVDQAISSYIQSEAGITTAKSALTKAEADYDRAKDLYEHNAVAQKEVLSAQAVLTQSKAALAQAMATREQSRRRIEMLGVKPGEFGQKMSLHAPISGKILEMSVVPGEFRNDLGTPVMKIADLSSVWISADIPESDIRMVRIGEGVAIKMSAYPNETFHGRVTQIADLVDAQTRTIKVRAEMANPDGKFRPEMFAEIRHSHGEVDRPVVPRGAVVQSDTGNTVWREVAPGQFESVPVTVGKRQGNLIPIASGIQAGDRIVVDGAMLLRAN